MKKFTKNIMSYDDARSQIKDGDIVFVAESTKFIDRVIQTFTGSTIYHVGIACWLEAPWGEKILFSCEQWYGGRRIVNLNSYTKSTLVVVDNPIKTKFKSYGEELINNTGAAYGYLDFIGAGVNDLIGVEMKNTDGEICSEMIMRILNNHLNTKLPTVITPAQLFDVLTDTLHCNVKLQTEKRK